MYRTCSYLLIASTCLASGCTQTVRHTNTLLFATNTQIAVSAGTNATSQPEIMVGYKRQEAVVMPLVANYAPHTNKPGKLVPCSSPSSPPNANCLIVGKNGTAGAQDSYSVLASFGAKFGGRTDKANPEASVGIAQYFATGVAAQLLAATGGASIISTAAPEAMTPAKAAAVAAVMKPNDAQMAVLGVANYEAALAQGIAASNKRNIVANAGASCFKDPTKGPKLIAALASADALKDKAAEIEAAGKKSADALAIYLQDAGSPVEKEFGNQIVTHC